METISKTIVYSNGDILNIAKCRELLFQYWQLSEAEKRAFDRLCGRSDLKKIFEETTLSDENTF